IACAARPLACCPDGDDSARMDGRRATADRPDANAGRAEPAARSTRFVAMRTKAAILGPSCVFTDGSPEPGGRSVPERNSGGALSGDPVLVFVGIWRILPGDPAGPQPVPGRQPVAGPRCPVDAVGTAPAQRDHPDLPGLVHVIQSAPGQL